jgi:Ion channel
VATGSNERTLRQSIMGRDSYILLFFMLLICYTVLMLSDSERWGGLVRGVPVSIMVLFALHTSQARPRVVRLAQFAVVLAIVIGTFQAITADRHTDSLAYFVVTLLLLITPLSIMRRVLKHRRVHVETLFAAVDVYIILGLIFSVLFIAIANLYTDPGPLYHVGSPFLAQPGPHGPSDYVYLSFVTLTTVGFGDLTPLGNLARSVVVLEALLGQIFLVTTVARLVSLYGRERVGLGPGGMFSRDDDPGLDELAIEDQQAASPDAAKGKEEPDLPR